MSNSDLSSADVTRKLEYAKRMIDYLQTRVDKIEGMFRFASSLPANFKCSNINFSQMDCELQDIINIFEKQKAINEVTVLRTTCKNALHQLCKLPVPLPILYDKNEYNVFFSNTFSDVMNAVQACTSDSELIDLTIKIQYLKTNMYQIHARDKVRIALDMLNNARMVERFGYAFCDIWKVRLLTFDVTDTDIDIICNLLNESMKPSLEQQV